MSGSAQTAHVPTVTVVAGGSVESTTTDDLGRLLSRLDRRRDDWVRVPIERRVEYLRSAVSGVLEVAPAWVDRACSAKGVPRDSGWAGEEWISGPMVTVRYLRLLIAALEAGGRPQPASIATGPGGRTVARVFPAEFVDRVLYPGIEADVWIEPGKLPSQGRIYRRKEAGEFPPGCVCLVLGAGNIAAIPPTDLAQKLFAEDEVVVVKMNPVNDYLGPLLARAFRDLVDDGFLGFVYGGPEIAHAAIHDDRVGSLHLTGSDRTYDAIVWGSDPEEQARRKASNSPVVDKPFTAELGCVSPVLVSPGAWDPAELAFQAKNVAGMVTHNASFNCNAAKVLVLPTGWRQRDEFLDAVRDALAATPTRPAYYPGANERYGAFLDRYPQATVLGETGERAVPWTLVPDVPAVPGEYALQTEAFCGVLAQIEVDAGRECDPATFLGNAVRFVNDHVWGSLSCSILIGSAPRRALGGGLERAIAALRYGGIGVNVWPGLLFGLGNTSWGAFPGNTRAAIGSGVGAVHNAFLFDHPERSVARAPATLFPKPVWFPDHGNLAALGRKVTRFEASPSLMAVPGLGLSALLG